MCKFVSSLAKGVCLLPLLALVLLCGCSSLQVSQVSQASQAPTSAVKTHFASYVGKWEVHGSLLSINADHTGLEQWNVGPCSESQMCNGNAKLTFTGNADGSITGNIQSISYSQWNGAPAPSGFQPASDDPQAGDTFQLQHSGAHLLYTTWLGKRLNALNNNNRYWCDSYASKAGWKQCGA